MSLMDMGYKPKKTDMSQPMNTEEPKIQYPNMYIDHNVPEDIMDKDVGHICRLEIVAKVISKSIDEHGGDKRMRVELEIHKMGYISEAGKKTKDEYLDMNDNEREDYDKKDKDVDEEKSKEDEE